MRVPEDIAIVGYNDIPLASRLVPGLTTVHVPIHELGTVAAGLLLEQIDSGEPRQRRGVFNPKLVLRGSTVAGIDATAAGRAVWPFATE